MHKKNWLMMLSSMRVGCSPNEAFATLLLVWSVSRIQTAGRGVLTTLSWACIQLLEDNTQACCMCTLLSFRELVMGQCKLHGKCNRNVCKSKGKAKSPTNHLSPQYPYLSRSIAFLIHVTITNYFCSECPQYKILSLSWARSVGPNSSCQQPYVLPAT